MPAFWHDVRHGFLRKPFHVAEVPDAPPNAADEIRVGKFPPDYSGLPARSARTSGTFATMLLTNADSRRDSADDTPNPPAPVEMLTWARWCGRIN